MKRERKSHRQFCSVCGRVYRVDYFVPKDIWELATHNSQRESLICLACFTEMADERQVEWCKDIKFFPMSLIKYSREIKGESLIH